MASHSALPATSVLLFVPTLYFSSAYLHSREEMKVPGSCHISLGNDQSWNAKKIAFSQNFFLFSTFQHPLQNVTNFGLSVHLYASTGERGERHQTPLKYTLIYPFCAPSHLYVLFLQTFMFQTLIILLPDIYLELQQIPLSLGCRWVELRLLN